MARLSHAAHSAVLLAIAVVAWTLGLGKACAADQSTPTTAKPAQRAQPAQRAKSAQLSKPGNSGKPTARVRLGPSYANRADALRFAEATAQQHGLPRHWVSQAIGQCRQLPHIRALVLPAGSSGNTGTNWTVYRARTVEPQRIQAGVRFWQQHQQALAQAEQTYGVPAAIVVGILGVETRYGRDSGRLRALDSLCTLAFDFPAEHPRAAARSAFFQDELAQLLLLARQENIAPSSLKGSYAGALGLPQFMPSSWRRYAVDGDGDGHIDLLHSPADAIASVAHYLQAFGWQTGQATHYGVTLDPASEGTALLLRNDITPHFSAQDMAALGTQLDAAGMQHPGPLALIELRNGDSPAQYVAGTQNFYTLTRYNWSSTYAMAVIELGQAVAERMNQRSPSQ